MRRSTKYLSYDTAKQYVGKLGFKSLLEYRNYITSHNINFLPLKPAIHYYTKGYSTPEFLGIDIETYNSHMHEYRTSQCASMRTRLTPESQAKRVKTVQAKAKKATKLSVGRPKIAQPTIQTIVKGLDPDKVIKFLITEDVEPATIVKMVAEMDIKSSTLMNDLCKYMQERSQRQAQLWRPTAYQTAEAEFTKVG